MASESVEQVVERLVREFGFGVVSPNSRWISDGDAVNLATAAYLAGQQAERERCAQLIESKQWLKANQRQVLAAAIRRGE